MKSPIRVRFAPSPTGFFHIGGARTALFNWLYAKHTGGTFVLRIEDTDGARNSEAFLQIIYDSMKWLGLDWSEGPGVGGDFGPYRQSERGTIYATYLNRLKATGRTYEKDGATWFRILGERYETFDEHRQKKITKVKAVPMVIEDAIRGRVERMEDEDFVIVRSDGNPVFHFVNVVDDIAMQITHVIRGEDHLSNTSKHIALFEAFEVPPPVYAHIPLILKSNGPGKMSKRDQGALIEEYQSRGFLPEALVNYISLLGWNPGGDREKMSIAEIVQLFDLSEINQSNARFDEKKMVHMNMLYILELSPQRFLTQAWDYFTKHKVFDEQGEKQIPQPTMQHFASVMELAQPKIKGLEELPGYTGYFWHEQYQIDEKAFAKIRGKGEPQLRLTELSELLVTADFTSDATLEAAIKSFAESKGLGFGDYQGVARVAVTGLSAGPSLTSLIRLLGRDKVLARLHRFAKKL
jgi:glutamyl/glutaminyl-tRNA synthetase